MSTDFSFIVKDNEGATQAALDRGDYIQAFLLIHTLIESLMRIFLGKTNRINFDSLIQEYEKFLKREGQENATFFEELIQFNRQRNRIVHHLWKKGYTFTNRKSKDAAYAAVMVYSLFIEFLQTFDESLRDKGFRIEENN